MLFKNVTGQKVHVYAYDSTTGAPKTGDAANITGYVSLDGTANAIDDTNPAEVDATNMPGVYCFDLAQAETNCNAWALYAKSATSNIRIEPLIGFTTGAAVTQTGDSYPIVSHTDYGNAKLVRSTTPENTLTIDANHLVAVPATQDVNAKTITAGAIANASFNADVGSTAYASNIIALAVRKVLDELKLDHLLAVAESDDAVDNSIIAKLAAPGGDWSTFVGSTDSLQAIRDRGDSAWITATGFAVAGDKMDLIDAPNGTAVTAIQSGLATPTNITAGTITTVTNLTNAPTNGDFTEAMKASVTAAVPTAAIGTDAASKVLVTPAQKLVTDANGYVTYSNTAPPSAADIKTAMEAVGGYLALAKTAAEAVDTLTKASGSGDLAALVTLSSAMKTILDKVDKSASTIVPGSAAAGTLSTTEMTSDLTEATDDHYNGRIIIWTSGVLQNQATDITDYDGATKKLVYTAVTEAPTAADTFIII